MPAELNCSPDHEFRTEHHWFRSGDYSLLAHLDVPAIPARSGVVIVPPFGWDEICAYRPLRTLARKLASLGIAVLRFDLPATGDSSGSALDHSLLAAWIQSVGDAAAELKKLTGVQEVSIFGIRLGAMLALAAASAGAPSDNLILWGASASGRALLRELRAFRNLEVNETGEGERAPVPPVEGLEVAGFLLSRETEGELESFQFADPGAMPEKRVLLLTRDSFPHDNKLVQVLEKTGCQLTLNTGEGYQNLLAAPHEPLAFSAATEQAILQFLLPEAELPATPAAAAEPVPLEVVGRVGGGVLEIALPLTYRGESLFSVLVKRAEIGFSSEWGLLFMNAGGVRHIGPNRMWVEAARRWAARGIPSMRVDFHGVGESDGDELATIASLHREDLVDQLKLAMDTMRSETGCTKFIAIGLCSGAYAAFQSLIRDAAIRSAILLNARLFFWDPELEPRRMAKRAGAGCTDLGYWRRLVRGEIHPERVLQAASLLMRNFFRSGRDRYIPAEALRQAWRQVKRFETRVTLVFADGEPLLEEMIQEKQMPSAGLSTVRCVQVGKTGHTFRSLWAQQLVQDLIDAEVDAATGRNHSSPVATERIPALV